MMKRDLRLHLDVSNYRRSVLLAEEEKALEVSISEEGWQIMLQPLLRRVIAVTRGNLDQTESFPSEGDPRFRKSFEAVHDNLATRHFMMGGPAAENVLCRKLSRMVGEHLPAAPESWEAIAATLDRSFPWSEMVEGIPVERIEAAAGYLTRRIDDLMSYFESPDIWRSNLPDVLQRLDEEIQQLSDTWARARVLNRYADQTILSFRTNFTSLLIARQSPSTWLTWAVNLPHAMLTATAIQSVNDLDFIQDLAAEGVALPRSSTHELVLVLIVQQALHLWEEVGRSLLRATETSYGFTEEDRLSHARALEAWEQTEMPARCVAMATFLTTTHAGVQAAILVLKHITVFGVGTVINERQPHRSLRDELLERLDADEGDAIFSRLLASPTASGLLGAALMACKKNTVPRANAVMAGYEAWLRMDAFYWSNPLVDQDRELAYALASVLGQMASPSMFASSLLSGIHKSPQGWDFNLSVWLGHISRATHPLIVIAMSSVVALDIGHAEEAADLMELSWNALEHFLRDAPSDLRLEQISSAVTFVWACAGRTLSAREERVAAGLKKFDDVALMIQAAVNFHGNYGSLPEDAQNVLRNAFESHEEILKAQRQVSAKDLETLKRQLDEVAPTI